jgi:predicted kinase
MMPDNAGVILITGIMAAGKSTVAQNLAEQLPNSVHLRGDIFRRMIVNGRVEMNPDLAEEAYAQLRLRYRLAVMAAGEYCAAGFTVVYQDVILGADLADMVQLLKTHEAIPRLRVIVLCPSPEVVAQREAGRSKTGYGAWTPADLDAGLRQDTPPVGWWLDTSAFSVEETVKQILAAPDRGLIEAASPPFDTPAR